MEMQDLVRLTEAFMLCDVLRSCLDMSVNRSTMSTPVILILALA